MSYCHECGAEQATAKTAAGAYGDVTGEGRIAGTLKMRPDGAIEIDLTVITGLNLSLYHGTGSPAAEVAASLAHEFEKAVIVNAWPYGNGKLTLMVKPTR